MAMVVDVREKIRILAMSEKNIYQRVNAIMKECSYIKKEGAGMGKGVRYDDVIAMLRPLMIEHGVVMVVNQISFFHIPELGGGKQNLFEGLYKLDLINIDKPEERMSQTASGQGMDAGDKAPGKAQTYAVKIMLTKGFALETGEDEESRADKMDSQNIISQEQYSQIEPFLTEEISGEVKWNNLHGRVLGAYKIGSLKNLPASKFNEVMGKLKNGNN